MKKFVLKTREGQTLGEYSTKKDMFFQMYLVAEQNPDAEFEHDVRDTMVDFKQFMDGLHALQIEAMNVNHVRSFEIDLSRRSYDKLLCVAVRLYDKDYNTLASGSADEETDKDQMSGILSDIMAVLADPNCGKAETAEDKEKAE